MAVAYLQLSFMTGDRGDFDRAAEMFEKAVALDPSNGLLVINSANPILQGAPAGDHRRRDRPEAAQAGRLARPAPLPLSRPGGPQGVRGEGPDDPGVARALALYDKAVLLAPKRDESYALSTIYEFYHDVEKLRRVLGRLEAVEDSTSPTNRAGPRLLRRQARREDPNHLAAGLPRIEAHYAAAKAGPGGPTLAVAAARPGPGPDVGRIGRPVRGRRRGRQAGRGGIRRRPVVGFQVGAIRPCCSAPATRWRVASPRYGEFVSKYKHGARTEPPAGRGARR